MWEIWGGRGYGKGAGLREYGEAGEREVGGATGEGRG